MNEQSSAWLSAIEGLPAIHARLQRVVILNQPALDVLRTQDGPSTLFYFDPRYLHSTRAITDDYRHEMSWREHALLLDRLSRIKGRVLLSGYPSDLYSVAERVFGWQRHERQITNHAASGASKRVMTECVWTNY